MRIARESWILAAVCIADLITTLWLVGNQGAREGNPVMDFFLMQGIFAFIVAKLALFTVPIAILEWARRRRPLFVQAMLRLAICGYVGSYALVVWRINAPAAAEDMSASKIAAIERECAHPATQDDLRREMDRLTHVRLSDAR